MTFAVLIAGAISFVFVWWLAQSPPTASIAHTSHGNLPPLTCRSVPFADLTMTLNEKSLPDGWFTDWHSNEHTMLAQLVQDGQVWARAMVRADGCVDYERAFNVPFPEARGADVDHIHICNPREMAEHLTRIAELSRVHFGERRKTPGEIV